MLPLKDTSIGLQNIKIFNDCPLLIFRGGQFMSSGIVKISADPIGIKRDIIFRNELFLQEELLELRKLLIASF
jgi:hypothetical protein